MFASGALRFMLQRAHWPVYRVTLLGNGSTASGLRKINVQEPDRNKIAPRLHLGATVGTCPAERKRSGNAETRTKRASWERRTGEAFELVKGGTMEGFLNWAAQKVTFKRLRRHRWRRGAVGNKRGDANR